MKKYELRKASCEVKKSEIKKGCTLYAVESELIQAFDDKRKVIFLFYREDKGKGQLSENCPVMGKKMLGGNAQYQKKSIREI